jgi:hypothetical protein
MRPSAGATRPSSKACSFERAPKAGLAKVSWSRRASIGPWPVDPLGRKIRQNLCGGGPPTARAKPTQDLNPPARNLSRTSPVRRPEGRTEGGFRGRPSVPPPSPLSDIGQRENRMGALTRASGPGTTAPSRSIRKRPIIPRSIRPASIRPMPNRSWRWAVLNGHSNHIRILCRGP